MLYLILDNIARKRGVFWGMVLLNAIALAAVGVACFIGVLNIYNSKSADKALSGGIYQSGSVEWTPKDDNADWSNEKLADFFRTLTAADEIAAVGSFGYYVGDKLYWAPLVEAENKLESTRPDLLSGECEFLSMNFTLPAFCGLEIAEGIGFEEAEKLADDITDIVYLGANLTEVPIGSVYEVEDEEGNVFFRYYVAGILKENSYWVQTGFASESGGDFLPTYDMVCLDNMFVELDNKGVSFGAYYSPAPGYTLADADEAIDRVSEQYGLTAVTEVLADAIYDRDSFNREIISYSAGIALIVILTSITIMVCMHLSTFVLRSREYGVLYANGYKRKNLITIAVGENLIRGIVSLFFAAAPLYFFICQIAVYDWSDAKKKIFWGGTVPFMVLVMLLIVLFCSLVPVVTFLRKRPAELLENRF